MARLRPRGDPGNLKPLIPDLIDNVNLSAENWVELHENGTNTSMLTLGEWAELHEFASWLETPQATRVRKTHTQTGRQIIENLMIQPPTRATLQSAGEALEEPRKRQSLQLWHYRCCLNALQRFRIWRKGGVWQWMQPGPSLPMFTTKDASITNAETLNDILQKKKVLVDYASNANREEMCCHAGQISPAAHQK